ncbi:MAG: helix-turn-helix transcriptional regulator [Gammaproteobacteria bacterium]|nr:helix-turn-helix transcriptional regulator [Gammaproteobacteria bacterium]
MEYSIQPLLAVLKVAREQKGLSQRAFSAEIGVPQGRLSRIENGAVDVRLSSLLDIARALDLDLMLVPRQLVPAVGVLVNQTLAQGAAGSSGMLAGEEKESSPALPAYRLDEEDKADDV